MVKRSLFLLLLLPGLALAVLPGRALAEDNVPVPVDVEAAEQLAVDLVQRGWGTAPLPAIFSPSVLADMPMEPQNELGFPFDPGQRFLSLTGADVPRNRIGGMFFAPRSLRLELALHRFGEWSAAMPNTGFARIGTNSPYAVPVAPKWQTQVFVTNDAFRPGAGHTHQLWLRAGLGVAQWGPNGPEDVLPTKIFDPATQKWVDAPRGHVVWFAGTWQGDHRAILHRSRGLPAGRFRSFVSVDLMAPHKTLPVDARRMRQATQRLRTLRARARR